MNIAQNQLNYYRQQRDLSPTSFFANTQTSYSTCVGTIDTKKYTCTIIYENIDNGVKMTVNVGWNDGDKKLNVEMSAELAKPSK